MENCLGEELSTPSGDSSWQGAVLVGSSPRGELSWWELSSLELS